MSRENGEKTSSPELEESYSSYWFSQLWLPEGWQHKVRVIVDELGVIRRIELNADCRRSDERLGATIPGIPNTHSHAFQRAMAGMAEYQHSSTDTFWTWRRSMYDIANKVSPDDTRIIATQLYVEMLKAGYTSVAEFHYLHHRSNGSHFSNPAQLSNSILDAAELSGIGITHMPVLYMTNDFASTALDKDRRRFGCNLDTYLRILEGVIARCDSNNKMAVALALHSLRAVQPKAISEAIAAYDDLSPKGPVHLHIAEQVLEVQNCLETRGMRPVEWLLNEHEVNHRWCLVHATHITNEESRKVAQSGAVISICPTTEANLGDGLFPLQEYLSFDGKIAIGSDSNISISAIEELRWLEYGQRLSRQRRNVTATPNVRHTGDSLLALALDGGRRATGQNVGRISVGNRADWLVLDENSVSLYQVPARSLMDAVVFSGNQNPFRHVMVSGEWRIRDFRFIGEESIAEEFRDVVRKLRVRAH